MDLRLILVLCFLAATRAASQSDIFNGQCAKQCKTSELNEYASGQTHIYKYSTRTLVNSWKTEIDIKGDVYLTRLDTCDYSLELKNVAINGVPDARSWEDQLKVHALRFGWIDGEISDVCHHPEEEEWAINIKKAIISSLQVVGTSGYVKKVERDVLGDCQTTYQQGEVSNDRIVMHKVKNIASCERKHADQIVGVVEAILAPGISEYQCKQIWSPTYVLKSVKCGHIAPAQTQAMANLTMEYVRSENGQPKTLESFRRSELHASRVELPKRSISEVRDSMADLCQAVAGQVQSRSPAAFHELTHSLETLEYDELKQIWDSMTSGQIHETCKDDRVKILVVDALLQSRTGPGLKFLVKDLHKNGEISEMKLKAAIYSLVYKPRPCIETMEAITELLRSDKSFKQSLFGMTAAIQKYYELTHDKVAASLALDLIVARLHNVEEEEKIVVVRALSNIRFDTEKLIQAFNQYLSSGKPELKVAVIDALSVVESCQESIYGKLRQMVLKTSQPNEVRIRALKVYLRCADEEAVSQLKSYIETHPEDGHFVSYADSFLRNVLTTMNPDKQVEKEAASLGQSCWKAPKMTMARNIEFSRVTPEDIFGLNYEVDSILENGQEMPTWLVFNASIPVRRVNKMNVELGLRQEGMEKLASTLMKKFNQIKIKDWEKIVKEAKDQRSYQPIVKELTKIVKEIEKLVEQNSKFSAYIKINGVTLFYLNGVESNFEKTETLKRFIFENTDARKAIEATLGWVFVDYKIDTPLASGLTFRYKHEGSLIPSLKAYIKSSDSTSDNHSYGYFRTYAVEFIYGRELVLKKPVASQLTKLNLNSDIALEGLHTLVRSNDAKVHTFTLNTRDEMDLARFEVSKLIRNSNGVEVTEESFPGLNKKWCSAEYTEKVLGLVVCYDGQEEFNSLMTKKSSRVLRRFYVKKTDKNLKNYQLVVKMGRDAQTIIFDTPNTKVNRKVEITLGQSGDLVYKKNFAGKFWLTVNTPVKSFDVNLSAAFPTGQEWLVNLETRVDRQLHSARIALAPKSSRQHVLNLMINSPLLREKVDYDLTFTHPIEAGNEMMAQIHSNRMNNKRNRLALIKVIRNQQDQTKLGKIEFELNNERAEKIVALLFDGSIKGSFPSITALQYNGKVEYRRQQGKMETVQLNGNLKMDSTGEAKAISNNWELKTTQWPQVNGKLTQKIFYKPSEHLNNEVELRWGRDYDQESTLNRFVLRQVSSMKAVGNNVVEVKNSLIAENRAKRFNHKIEANVNVKPRFMDLVKLELIHSDLNKPENNHKLVIDSKASTHDEGTLNVILTSGKTTRSIKTTYNLNKSSPRLATIYKVEPSGQSVRGYHISASLDQTSAKKVASLEVTSHPENRQIFKTEVDLAKEQSKTAANLKISTREGNLINAEFAKNSDYIKGKLNLPRAGSVEANWDNAKNSLKVITKDNKGLTHELAAVNGKNKKEIRSMTLNGAPVVPNFEISMDKEADIARFNLRTERFNIDAQLNNYNRKVDQSLRVEYDCFDHQHKHLTQIKSSNGLAAWSSEHKVKGKVVFNFNVSLEDKSDLKTGRYNLKFGTLESNVQSVYDKQKQITKVDMSAVKDDYESKVGFTLAMPTERTRFSRMTVSKMPNFDISVNLADKKSLKELTMAIGNTKFYKAHMQLRNGKGVPFVFDSKFQSDRYEIIGHANELVWDFHLNPQAKKLDITIGYGKTNKLDLTLNKQSSQWNAKTKLVVKGEDKLDARIEGRFADNLIAGPHSILIQNFDSEMQMTYKLDNNKLELTFGAKDEGVNVVGLKFNGDKFQRGNKVYDLKGKLELTSDKINAIRQAVYEVRYNRDGRQVELQVEKKGSNPMNMKILTDVSRESAKIQGEIAGRTASGKQRKLAIDYNRLNKIDFSAKLYDMSKVDSELGVTIPLVKVAEFVGNEANFFLRSKSLDTEITLSLTAPSKTSITGLADIKVRGERLLTYNLAVNDGSSSQFFGSEKINDQLTNPIAMFNELIFKGKSVFTHQIMVSDKLISFKTESPNLFKVNQAFILKEKDPEVLGKYCWRSSCTKVSSKLVLGQKGLIEMKVEGPNGAQQKYDIYFKWNQEKGNEYSSFLVVKNERKYGLEMTRRLSDNSMKTVVESKITLPKRVMTLTTTQKIEPTSTKQFHRTWIVTFIPKENAKPLQLTVDGAFDRNRRNGDLKIDYSIKLEHGIDSPLAIELVQQSKFYKSDDRRSSLWGYKSGDIKLGLNYGANSGSNHDLTANWHFDMSENRINYDWRVWQKENKIDFGCKGFYSQMSDRKTKDIDTARDYTCHWVDRKGERKEFKREEKLSIKSMLETGLPRITYHDNMKHPLLSYFYNGTFHLFDAIKDATIDFHTEDGSRYKLQARMDTTQKEKCLDMSLYEATKEEEKYGVRTCLNLKARSGKPVFLFEMITFGKSVNMADGERKVSFTVKKMKDFVNDYLVSLIWDTNSMAQATYQAIDTVEKFSNKRAVLLKERDAELEDKMEYIRSSVVDRMEKMKEQLNREVEEFTAEMKPEHEMIKRLVAKALPVSRSRRGIFESRNETEVDLDLTSPMSYEWKEYDIENGRLELVLRNALIHNFPYFVYEILLKNSLI